MVNFGCAAVWHVLSVYLYQLYHTEDNSENVRVKVQVGDDPVENRRSIMSEKLSPS